MEASTSTVRQNVIQTVDLSYLQYGTVDKLKLSLDMVLISHNIMLTDCYKCSPIVSSIFEWNKLDNSLRTASSVNSFMRLFKQSYNL